MLATKSSQVFALSLSAPFIPQFFKDPLDQTSPYWDYIVGNETEATAYADSHDLNTHDISAIAKHLANLPKANSKRKRVAIVTQGTDPTVVAVQGEDKARTFPVHKIDANDIYDTTGAGDAFAGGFMAGVAKGESLERAVDMGSWLACLSLRELGPSYVPQNRIGNPYVLTSLGSLSLSRLIQHRDGTSVGVLAQMFQQLLAVAAYIPGHPSRCDEKC